MYDFQESSDPNEDLYFKEGEILTIIEYTQGEEWWKASNSNGKIGLIPVPLVRRLKIDEWALHSNGKTDKHHAEKLSEDTIYQEKAVIVQSEKDHVSYIKIYLKIKKYIKILILEGRNEKSNI
jgi:hypothetical protein